MTTALGLLMMCAFYVGPHAVIWIAVAPESTGWRFVCVCLSAVVFFLQLAASICIYIAKDDNEEDRRLRRAGLKAEEEARKKLREQIRARHIDLN